MNNDNYLNLHSMTKLSGWLRYWSESIQHLLKYEYHNLFEIQMMNFAMIFEQC